MAEEIRLDEVVLKDLKKNIKALNASGVLDTKIKLVGSTKKKLVDDFCDAIEKLIDEETIEDIDSAIADYYDSLFNDPETEDEEEAPKRKAKKPTSKKKAPAKKKTSTKKTPAKKKAAPKEKKKDEFGFTVGTKMNKFAMAIKKKRMTMDEVRELDWNENKAAYFGTFGKLKSEGKADKDKNGKMFIVKK